MLLIDGNEESWQIISQCFCSSVILFFSYPAWLSALRPVWPVDNAVLQTRLTRSIMYIVSSVCRCFTLYALFRFPTRNWIPERRERQRVWGGSCGECCRALSSPNSTTIQQLRPSRRPHSFTHWSAPLIPSTCLHFIINKHPVIIFSHYFCHVFNPPHFAVMRGSVYGPLVFLLVWFTTNWIHWIYLKKKAACFSNLNQFFALFIIFIVVKVLSVCI